MRCSGRPDHSDDNIVTSFCEVVTPRYTTANSRRGRLATTGMGEAMAPAPESPPSAGNRFGAGAAPIMRRCAALPLPLALVLAGWLGLAACGDDGARSSRPPQVAAAGRAAADPALGVT